MGQFFIFHSKNTMVVYIWLNTTLPDATVDALAALNASGVVDAGPLSE